jgi:hypothetical protein
MAADSAPAWERARGAPGEWPRCIYTYWHELPMPDCVQRCVDTMRTCNPEWEVVVLTRASFPVPVDVSRLQVAHQSDWIRLEVLSERGGVWLDASCICTAPVERWAGAADSALLVGFEYHTRCIESFAFACPPRHPLVLAWRDEFRHAVAIGHTAYCAEPRVLAPLAPLPHLGKDMPYLTVYACFLAARGAHPHLASARLLRLLPATAPEGPFWYLSASPSQLGARMDWAWNSERIVAQLANLPTGRAQLTKLVRWHRPILQRRIDDHDYTADSLMRTSFELPLPVADRLDLAGAGALIAASLLAQLLVVALRRLRRRGLGPGLGPVRGGWVGVAVVVAVAVVLLLLLRR